MTAQEQAKIWQEQIELAIQQGIKERSPEHLKKVIQTMAIAFGFPAYLS